MIIHAIPTLLVEVEAAKATGPGLGDILLLSDNSSHEQINNSVVIHVQDLIKQARGEKSILSLAFNQKDAVILCQKLISALIKCDDNIAKALDAELNRLIEENRCDG